MKEVAELNCFVPNSSRFLRTVDNEELVGNLISLREIQTDFVMFNHRQISDQGSAGGKLKEHP